MRSVTEHLHQEHELITQVLAAVEPLSARLRRGDQVVLPTISCALDFFAAFVGRCHDAKEEQGLFPVLSRCGADAALLAALGAEHEEGRRLLAMLRPAAAHGLDAEAIDLLAAYASLLGRHVANENTTLFPLADRILSTSAEARVRRAFDRVEKRALGPGGRDVLRALAGALTHACRALGANGKGGRPEMLAKHVARPKRVALAPGDSLARAADLMESLGARELPVVDGGVLVGILAQSDLQPHRGHYEWTTVRAAMSPDPMTVEPETPIRAVARLLLERSFNSVPVAAGGVLIGMIGRSDLVRLLAEETPAPAVTRPPARH